MAVDKRVDQFGVATLPLLQTDIFPVVQGAGTAALQCTLADIKLGTNPNYLQTTISLTTAQIKTLNSIPVLAIAAPGAGLAIELISGSIKYTFGGVAFNSPDVYQVGPALAQFQLFSASHIDSGISFFSKLQDNVGIDTAQLATNGAIFITAASDSVVGNGSSKIYLAYRIITV